MALLSSFFKGKNHSNSPIAEEISVETLKNLIPIRNLSEEKLQSFALEKKSEVLAAGETLFKINSLSDSAIYLLNGTVSLTDGNNKSFEIEATETKAKFPITSGIKHTTTAIAKSKVSILRVSQKLCLSIQKDTNHLN